MSAGKDLGDPALRDLIDATPWLDTHEHLVEEHHRLVPGGYEFIPTAQPKEGAEPRMRIPGDWTALLDPAYVMADLVCAGMPAEQAASFHSDQGCPAEEAWSAVEPYVAAARNTGYLRALDITTERLFGSRLERDTVEEIDKRLRALRAEGFYAKVLREVANVSRCQVHSVDSDLICLTRQPELLHQDLVLVPLVFGSYPAVEEACGIDVGELDDYLEVIEWVFAQFAGRASAVKCAWAYQRPLLVDVPSAPPRGEFIRVRRGTATAADRRFVEDFLLQRCIDLATAAGLPVKMHLGYLAGSHNPQFRHIFSDVADVVPLLQANPATTFVLMHIAWPKQEELLALAKHHPNVVVDLCWSWIVSPRSTQDFLERALTSLPASKLLCFGGDFQTVEHVVGHAEIARRGLQRTLEGLLADDWIAAADIEGRVATLMHGNAERIFPDTTPVAGT
jgi:hypothetical protein